MTLDDLVGLSTTEAIQAAAALGEDAARLNEVTAPALGLPAIEDAPIEEGDVKLWSVTTMIGVLDKKGIPYWTAEAAAKAAIRQQATWRGMLEDDERMNPACDHTEAAKCPVVKWLRDAAYRRAPGERTAGELGTAIHVAAEEYALSGVRPEVDAEVAPFLDRFDEWLDRFSPTYHATEVAVYHPDLGYAGTADCFLAIGGHGSPTLPGTDAVEFLGDYKTTRKALGSDGKPTRPYPSEAAPQLAAYRFAKSAAIWRPRRREEFRRRYYLLSEAERAMAQPVPEVDTGLIIHITPEACEAFPMRCDEPVFEAYLAIQDAARWVFQDSRTAMGEPLVPVPYREENR